MSGDKIGDKSVRCGWAGARMLLQLRRERFVGLEVYVAVDRQAEFSAQGAEFL